MKRIFPLLTLLTLSLIPLANECWLQPDKFIYKWNETINIRFFTGENFEGKTWTNGSKGDASLSIYFDGVKDDMTDELTDENNDSFQLKLLD